MYVPIGGIEQRIQMRGAPDTPIKASALSEFLIYPSLKSIIFIYQCIRVLLENSPEMTQISDLSRPPLPEFRCTDSLRSQDTSRAAVDLARND